MKHGDIEVTSASRNEVEVKNDKSERNRMVNFSLLFVYVKLFVPLFH